MSMINLNRTIEAESHVQFGVEGIFTCRAIKNGKIVRERTFRNLITNTGMDALQLDPSFLRMHLGTGTTAPAFTDTALASFGLSVVNSDPADTRGVSGTIPYYGWNKLVWLSAVGGATGTWTEIGISKTNATGNLRSRALILDSGGVPVSFPVLADEQFEGTYEFRVYVPLTDDVASITLSGVPYNATTRALQATTAGGTAQGGWAPTLTQTAPLFSAGTDSGGSSAMVYSGALQAITAVSLIGFIGSTIDRSTAAYVSGNHYVDSYNRFGGGALLSNIRTIKYVLNTGTFQIEYSPIFSKTATQQFVHNQRVSWARA